MKPPHIIEIPRQPIYMTEVTLRDGMQQDDIMHGEPTPIADRIEVFDALIDAGMRRIEIGHLGNEDGQDVAFTEELIAHMNYAKASGEDRYDDVELQVLFGSQLPLIERGIKALEGFDKDRVFVHVYDRLSPELRGLASEEYSSTKSAERILDAAQIALSNGFTKFSISGEGATDPQLDLDETVDFYVKVADGLIKRGATEVNCNLANTFGYSVGDATEAELTYFNKAVKSVGPQVTTSIHVHNDNNDAPGYAIAAVRAGFDRVEGTLIGMGERAGNVAIADVVTRLLEDARDRIDRETRGDTSTSIGGVAVRESLWEHRTIDPTVVNALDVLFAACAKVANIFGTHDRFHKTSLGNPAAYDAGSGPHAHANREFLRDPIAHPLWKSYGAIALIHAMAGRPEALEVIAVNEDRIRAITIKNHAAGTSTNQILDGEIVVAPESERQKSHELAQNAMDDIRERVGDDRPQRKRSSSSDPDVRALHEGTFVYDATNGLHA